MTRSTLPFVAALLALSVTITTSNAHAQVSTQPVTETVLTTEGISGDSDKKRRGPVLTVGVNHTNADDSSSRGGNVNTTLLVDAFIPNKEYEKYPIRFDFFVNRKLVSSQLRSVELPGPIGLEITPDVATIPFNYSVVATLLHPNREFTTILNGAVTSTAPTPPASAISQCNLEIVPGKDQELTVYVAKEVTVTSSESGKFSLSFQTSTLDDGSQGAPVTVTADITVTDGAASGTLETSVNDTNETVNVTGEAVVENNSLQSFELNPDLGVTKVSCF